MLTVLCPKLLQEHIILKKKERLSLIEIKDKTLKIFNNLLHICKRSETMSFGIFSTVWKQDSDLYITMATAFYFKLHDGLRCENSSNEPFGRR